MTTVALFRGNDRYRNVTQALTAIEHDVDWANKQRILVKPNFTSTVIPLAVTHVDAVRAVLDFLQPRTAGHVVIGEGAGLRDTWEGYRNYGYLPLRDQYGVDLVDLNRDEWVTTTVYDKRLRPLPLRVARTVVDSDLRISIGPPKTHDTIVVTLALKNLVMGALIRDEKGPGGPDAPAAHGGRTRSVGSTLQTIAHLVPQRVKALPLLLWLKERIVRQILHSDKMLMHQSIPVINLNLFELARFIPPHLAVLDGFRAMEGDGPNLGTPVDWRVAIASADWLAADTVAAHLMGVEIDKVGYLDYCRRARLGVGNLDRIDVVGNDSLAECRRVFQPSPTVEKQRAWQDPRIDAIIAQLAGG